VDSAGDDQPNHERPSEVFLQLNAYWSSADFRADEKSPGAACKLKRTGVALN
jgi:hypothetical protein